MLIVERFILARLRNRRFLSLGELNEAIREILGDLNARLMRRLGASRREFFQTIDRPALLPLPPEPYAYAERRRCRVAPDYHVEVHGHFYSVPSRLIREVVEARVTDTTVEIFHAGKRVAAHPRSAMKHRHTTVAEHMPSAHRRYASWTPARLLSLAAEVGPGMAALVKTILRTKPHPEQGFRACLGIPAAGQDLWRGPARGGLPTRADDRGAELRLDRLDPAHRPGPRLPGGSGTRPRFPVAREHPRPRLLPLKEEPMLMTKPGRPTPAMTAPLEAPSAPAVEVTLAETAWRARRSKAPHAFA